MPEGFLSIKTPESGVGSLGVGGFASDCLFLSDSDSFPNVRSAVRDHLPVWLAIAPLTAPSASAPASSDSLVE